MRNKFIWWISIKWYTNDLGSRVSALSREFKSYAQGVSTLSIIMLLIPITCGNNGWRFARVSKVPNKSNGVKGLEISVSILIDASCTTPLSSASPCQPSKTYTNFIWWLVLFLSTSTTALCMMRRNGHYLDKWLNWALIEICSSPTAILWSKTDWYKIR